MSNPTPTSPLSGQALTQLSPDDIRLGSNYYTNLSPGAITYLGEVTKNFALQLRERAEAVARDGHVRGTPLEIIPEHIEEARRMMVQRAAAKQGKLMPVLRFLLFALPLFAGVAGSYLANQRALNLFVALAVASLAVYLIIELESRRRG